MSSSQSLSFSEEFTSSLFLTGVRFTDRELGRGADAVVVEADHQGTLCAAKKLHQILLEDQSSGGAQRLVANFENEITTWYALRHPHIVLLLGVHFEKGSQVPALILEKMQSSLRRYIETYCKEEVSLADKVFILHQVSQALAYLHSRQPLPLVHHDLSPNNILLNQDSLLTKITDFGMSRVVDSSHSTRKSSMKGTPAFMPPEALVSPPKYTEKLDIFSFGNITLFTITHLWPEPGPPVVYKRKKPVAVEELQRREQYTRTITAEERSLFFAMIRSCLENRPDRRPTSLQLVQQMRQIEKAHPRPELTQQLKKMDSQLKLKDDQLKEKDVQVKQKDGENQQLQRDKQQLRQENQRLEEERDVLKRQLNGLGIASGQVQEPIKHQPDKLQQEQLQKEQPQQEQLQKKQPQQEQSQQEQPQQEQPQQEQLQQEQPQQDKPQHEQLPQQKRSIFQRFTDFFRSTPLDQEVSPVQSLPTPQHRHETPALPDSSSVCTLKAVATGLEEEVVDQLEQFQQKQLQYEQLLQRNESLQLLLDISRSPFHDQEVSPLPALPLPTPQHRPETPVQPLPTPQHRHKTPALPLPTPQHRHKTPALPLPTPQHRPETPVQPLPTPQHRPETPALPHSSSKPPPRNWSELKSQKTLKCDRGCYSIAVQGDVVCVCVGVVGRVLLFSKTSGTRVRDLGLGQLQIKSYMLGIAFIDEDTIVMSADRKLRIYTTKGQLVCMFDSGKNGFAPAGLTVGPDGRIFVCDYGNRCVCVFNVDGKLLSSFGSMVSGVGPFSYPRDVCMDGEGLLFISDKDNSRICVHSVEGAFIREFPTPRKPWCVAATHCNHLVVSSFSSDTVMIMTTSGQLVHEFGGEGRGPGQFMAPHGVAVDNEDCVYVCDSGNKRVQVY